MPLIPNISLFQSKLAGFPIATYQAGETVVAAAATTGRLLILRKVRFPSSGMASRSPR
jgi:hypothetical protein